MLLLLAMLLTAQSMKAMEVNVTSGEVNVLNSDSHKRSTTRRSETWTPCNSMLTADRGKIYYQCRSSSIEKYCDYFIVSGGGDVTITFVMFHLSENDCRAESITFRCSSHASTIVTPPYCGTFDPAPILLRSCDTVRIGLFREDMSKSSACGQFTIEYRIGQNSDNNIKVYDAKSAVYNNEAESKYITPATEKSTTTTKKAKKVIHNPTLLLDNINWLLGLLKHSLSYCEDSSRKTCGMQPLSSGNVMKWTPFLLWPALMTQLLGGMPRDLF